MSQLSTCSGLIIPWDDSVLYTDRQQFQGIFKTTESGEPEKVAEHICWFMNLSGNTLFSSIETEKNWLYNLDLITGKKEILVKEPCHSACLHEQWLYYITEKDGALHRINIDTRKQERLVSKGVTTMIIEGVELFYATGTGIEKCSLNGKEPVRLLTANPCGLAKVDGYLFYSDRNNGYTLCRYHIQSNVTQIINGVVTTDISADDNYAYCINLSDNKSICRVGTEGSSGIRIWSEPSFGLHLIEGYLYFYNLKDDSKPYRIQAAGGQAEAINERRGAF